MEWLLARIQPPISFHRSKRRMNLRTLITAVAVAALGLLACTSRAQTTYESEFVNVNVGNPGFATFVFAEPNPPSQTGSTQLIIQCNFNRAELITNTGVYGQQAQSAFFHITCDSTSGTQGGFKTETVTLNGTPLSESLTMTYANGNSYQLNLTINSATWTVVNPGAHQKVSGSAEIVY